MPFNFFISCADAIRDIIASTSNRLTANVISRFDCASHSKWLLWLPRPMYSSTHKPLYLSPFFSPKSSKIYRCWIVWGKNIRVVIIPSFLAITYLGQSSYLHLISRFQFIASSSLARATWHINICTKPNWDCWLGDYDGYNRSRHVHGCECSGDGFDRFQDPQGVLGS